MTIFALLKQFVFDLVHIFGLALKGERSFVDIYTLHGLLSSLC